MKYILVVEDNLVNQLVVKKSLNEAYNQSLITFNPKLYFCSTLKEAKKFLKNITPDLIILDLRLPDSEGENTFDEIRKATDCSIIVYSCLTKRNLQEDLLLKGARKFLVKPIEHTMATLANEINDVLASDEILYK